MKKKNSPQGSIIDTIDTHKKAIEKKATDTGKKAIKYVDTTLKDLRARMDKYAQSSPPDSDPDREITPTPSERSKMRGSLFDKSWDAIGEKENNPDRKPLKPAPPM